MHVRVRPLNDLEAEKGAAWRHENSKIFQINLATGEPVNETPYMLDNICGKGWSTQQVYEQTTQALIHKVVGGFNSTVFAYGQTSSGKTHTMRGTDTEPGIIPLAVGEIFDHIGRTQEREFLLRVSYMEVQCLSQNHTSPALTLLFNLSQAGSVPVPCVPAAMQ